MSTSLLARTHQFLRRYFKSKRVDTKRKMSNSVAPKISKWPFVFGDVLLIAFAAFVAAQSSRPISALEAGICLSALGIGAWLAAVPFLREYQATLALGEADVLATTVGQIQNLDALKTHIVNATNQWHGVQEQSTKTVAAARELSDRMKAELGEFCEFLKKSNEAEKQHLKLEVEKLRRGEGEWLQTVVHLLDHVFALHAAATRTRQPALMKQLDQFQFACRDLVRRMGLLAFAPSPSEPFNPESHQLPDAIQPAESGSLVASVLAPGYTYQGRMVRRALVTTSSSEHPTETRAESAQPHDSTESSSEDKNPRPTPPRSEEQLSL